MRSSSNSTRISRNERIPRRLASAAFRMRFKSMLLWFPVMTLIVEAARVIEMRLQLIALGRSTPNEVLLMVTEKIDALEEAKAIIVRGGNPALVVDHYRKIVAANAARLQGT